MSLEDLAFPPRTAEILAVTTGMVRASTPDEKPEVHARNILALDLGTHTGWAIRRRDGTIAHGTESFSPRKSWGPGQKWKRYRSWLLELLNREQIHAVTYELVIRHEVHGKALWDSAHAYGAFQAYTFEACESFNLVPKGVNLATVKKHWTGSGRAKKPDMIAEARRRGFRPDSDNAADALAILSWAIAQEDHDESK